MLSFNMDDDEEEEKSDEEDVKPVIKKAKIPKTEVKEEVKSEPADLDIKEEPEEDDELSMSTDCPKHTFSKKKKRLGEFNIFNQIF